MIRVEITEETLKIGRESFVAGDIKSFDDDVAQMIIDNGWGKNAETGETGERKPGAVKIKVDSVVQKLSAM